MATNDTKIVRIGWRQVGYEVSAEEFKKYERFQVLGILFILLPALWITLRYGIFRESSGVLGEPFISVSDFWWEFGVLLLWFLFLAVASRAGNTLYLKKLCSGKKPIDSGSSFVEQRRKVARHNLQTKKWVVFLAFGLILVNSYEGFVSGTFTAACLFFGVLACEVVYFRYFDGGQHHSSSSADMTK